MLAGEIIDAERATGFDDGHYQAALRADRDVSNQGEDLDLESL
jgi:hypothetical protein